MKKFFFTIIILLIFTVSIPVSVSANDETNIIIKSGSGNRVSFTSTSSLLGDYSRLNFSIESSPESQSGLRFVLLYNHISDGISINEQHEFQFNELIRFFDENSGSPGYDPGEETEIIPFQNMIWELDCELLDNETFQVECSANSETAEIIVQLKTVSQMTPSVAGTYHQGNLNMDVTFTRDLFELLAVSTHYSADFLVRGEDEQGIELSTSDFDWLQEASYNNDTIDVITSESSLDHEGIYSFLISENAPPGGQLFWD